MVALIPLGPLISVDIQMQFVMFVFVSDSGECVHYCIGKHMNTSCLCCVQPARMHVNIMTSPWTPYRGKHRSDKQYHSDDGYTSDPGQVRGEEEDETDGEPPLSAEVWIFNWNKGRSY